MNLGKWIMTSCACERKSHVCCIAVCASQLSKFCHTSTPVFSAKILAGVLLTYHIIDSHCGVKTIWYYFQKDCGWSLTLTGAIIGILLLLFLK
jgi:hypothetical protein